MRLPEEKILSFDGLPEASMQWHGTKKTIVSTNGCFDLLHLGHIQYLNQARKLGDLLIVGLNSDESVSGLKGPTRPLQEERVRALQLAALECVDAVAIFTQSTPIEFIRAVKPSIHVKGGDYKGQELPEKSVLDDLGAELKLLPEVEGFSTTALIEKMKSS